jgi:hypothetical protein
VKTSQLSSARDTAQPARRTRHLARLAAGVAAVTTLGTLGASAALAAPVRPAITAVTWSGSFGPLAQVKTNASPALTTFTLPGSPVVHTLMVWKGWQSDLHLYYKYSRTASLSSWTSKKVAGNGAATTLHRPSAAAYVVAGLHQIVVVWQGSGPDFDVWYEIAIEHHNGTLSWGPEQMIPGTATSNGPSVFAALHSGRLVLTWKVQTTSAIDYMIGYPLGGGIHWGAVRTLPHLAETDASPSVAEASTGRHSGKIYIFWSGTPLGRPFFETTADPITSSSPSWSPEFGFPFTRETRQIAGPVAEAVGPHNGYPLIVAYVGKTTTGILYLTLSKTNVLGPQLVLPGTRSIQAPGLAGNMIAATAATNNGQVFYNFRK